MMRALIVGASMAGLSAAHWLHRTGFDVTVVERSTTLRKGGAPIDVRGTALATARDMGIMNQISDFRISGGVPLPVIDSGGAVQASIDLTWFANESPEDIELTRDDLLGVLRQAVDPAVEFRFERTVTDLREEPDQVAVAFDDASTGRFDLVVGADGLHSTVRRLIFGPETRFLTHMGFYVGLVNLDSAREWTAGIYSVPGLMVSVRLDCGDPLAYVMFASDDLEIDYRDTLQQREALLRQLRGHRAWQVPDVYDAFADERSPGFYFDSVCQTHMDSWHSARTVLIGDAAHCASLLSGLGSSLAMSGAQRLAEALSAESTDITEALRRYEQAHRDPVSRAQASVSTNSVMMVPRTRRELEERNVELDRLAAQSRT